MDLTLQLTCALQCYREVSETFSTTTVGPKTPNCEDKFPSKTDVNSIGFFRSKGTCSQKVSLKDNLFTKLKNIGKSCDF